MSEAKRKESQCMAGIERIIDRNQAHKVKAVAEYLFSLNSKIEKYEVVCYDTESPDVRFTIIDPSNPPKRNRPFLLFRDDMEIHMLLDKIYANKYPYLEPKNSPKNCYKMRPPEGRKAEVESLIEIAHNALLSRCNSLNFSVSLDVIIKKQASQKQHSAGTFIPSKDDVEKILLDLGGVDISQDKLLAAIEKKFHDKGMKDNWREITIRNLELWAEQD